MHTIAKPYTDKQAEYCNRIFVELKKGVVLSRQNLCSLLGLQYNSSTDRIVRDCIAIISERYPIISKSNSVGYKMAISIEDAEQLKNSWAELDKKIKALQAKKIPMIKFFDANKINITT